MTEQAIALLNVSRTANCDAWREPQRAAVTSALASVLGGVLLLLASCTGEPPTALDSPVWGPIEQGKCTLSGSGLRHYQARLFGGDDGSCAGPPLNVMGAHFAEPSRCEGELGIWQVRDTSCAASLPPVPSRGANGAPPEPAEGYADLHNHLLARLAFGESVLWGAAFGEPETALTPIPEELRKPHQRIEALTASRSIFDLWNSHEEEGYPSFSNWPSPAFKTHQQSHVDWLYRAYQGGLRLVVVPAVNNQDMFGRGETRFSPLVKRLLGLFGSGAVPLAHRTSNDMEALEHQVRAAHELVAWVGEHRGGWLAIAETPEEADALIRAGKLALILGSEVDHPLNCDLGRRCSAAHINEGLTKLEALGVVVIFPTHHKETQFGDSANFQPLNSGPLRPCPQFTTDCAAQGLTQKGELLVREMMRRGLLADLGHAGDRPFADVMRLLESANYPVQMSHASAHPMKPNGGAEYTLTLAQLQRIDRVGGMVSLHSAGGEYAGMNNEGARIPLGNQAGGGGYTQGYRYSLDALQGAYFDSEQVAAGGQIAFAADWNGFAGWPFGRFDPTRDYARRLDATGANLPTPARLGYPFALPQNLLPAAVGGVDKLGLMQFYDVDYDFNKVGLAHAGLSPDLLEDMRMHGITEAELDPFYRSARGFITMWQRARNAPVAEDRGWLRWLAQSPTDLVDFEGWDRSRLVEVSPGVPICRKRSSGRIGSLVDSVCIPAGESAAPTPVSPDPGEIRNANSGLCLTALETNGAGHALLEQVVCSDTASQLWQFVPDQDNSDTGQLMLAGSRRCLAARDGQAETLPCSDADGVSLVRIGNTFHLRIAADDTARACLQIEDRRLDEGAAAIIAVCAVAGRADFQWEIDALREARESDRLFSTRALAGTVEWAMEQPVGLPHAIANEAGEPLCVAYGRLGRVRAGGCELARDAVATAGFKRLYTVDAII